MEWNSFKKIPPKAFGWYCVATLPRNHSGHPSVKNGSLKGDNEWRQSFGFTKAWLNNGRWFEADISTKRATDITAYVTHWAECPKVPELTETHVQEKESFDLYDKHHKESIIKMAMEQWENDQKTNSEKVNPNAYAYGFYSAFSLLGIR